MLAGSEAFGRAAGAVVALARRDRQAYAGMLAAIVADFEAREEHLTGVPIADTALVLDRLAERRGMAAHPRSPLLPEVDDVRAILTGTRVWAVVGCSPDPSRDSHRIASMLQRRGYEVIPVNPMATRDPRRALLPDAGRDPGRHRRRGRRPLPAPGGRRARTSTRRSRSARGRSGCSSA